MATLESALKASAKITGYMALYAMNEFAHTLPTESEAYLRMHDPAHAHKQLDALQRAQAGLLGKIALCYADLGASERAAVYARKAASEYFTINDIAKKE